MFYAITNKSLRLAEIKSFSNENPQFISKEPIEIKDIEALLATVSQEKIIVKDINDAKAIAVLLSTPHKSIHPLDDLEYTSSPLILAYPGSPNFSNPQKIDILLLVDYQDGEFEEELARNICEDIAKNEDLNKIRYTKKLITAAQKPEEVIYMDAFGKFCRKSLKSAAVQSKKLQLSY